MQVPSCNKEEEKNAEWTPPSLNKINSKGRLCGFLPKNLSHEMIHEPGGSVEALEKPQEILKSLQAVHQDTGKI